MDRQAGVMMSFRKIIEFRSSQPVSVHPVYMVRWADIAYLGVNKENNFFYLCLYGRTDAVHKRPAAMALHFKL